MYAATKAYSDKELREQFDMFDKDKNGVVSAAELAQKLSHMTSNDVQALIKEVDKNNDGNIDLDEVCSVHLEFVCVCGCE